MGEVRNAYKIFVPKSEGMRTLWRSRRMLEYNIKINVKEMESADMDWNNLA
jgi:hypothetical protein